MAILLLPDMGVTMGLYTTARCCGNRDVSTRRRTRASNGACRDILQSARENKQQQYQDDESQATAGVIAPGSAMRPGRECAGGGQYKND